MNDSVTCLFPPKFREIVDVIGVHSALLMMEHFGGLPVYIPDGKSLCEDSQIVRVIGREKANLLSAHFHTDSIYVPMPHCRPNELRNRAIAQKRRQGAPRWTLAREYALSARQISNITGSGFESETGALQLDLFESFT